jgi:hypothetical protein
MSTHLLAHQVRVIEERVALAEKLEKLRTFVGGALFQTVSRDEQRRLTRQTLVMSDYLEILDQRIGAFHVAD